MISTNTVTTFVLLIHNQDMLTEKQLGLKKLKPLKNFKNPRFILRNRSPKDI